MEFTPRFPQPFTIQEAIAMDASVLTEEITRLQNSLVHLKNTQKTLEECIAEDADPELTKAFEENQGVVGSQEERIRMLKFALSEKGVFFNEHYDLAPVKQSTQQRPQRELSSPGTTSESTEFRTTLNEDRNTGLEEIDDGLHL